MIPQESMLEVLVKMIDRIPVPADQPAKPGRPVTYPEKLFLKALVIMIVKHLHKVQIRFANRAAPFPEVLCVITT